MDSCCLGSITHTIPVISLCKELLCGGSSRSEMHIASARTHTHTHMSLHMCVSHRKSARIAFVSQLAAACQECADVHINTYRLRSASASTPLQPFDACWKMRLRQPQLSALNRGGAFVFPTGAAFSRSNVHILSCIPRNDLGVTS